MRTFIKLISTAFRIYLWIEQLFKLMRRTLKTRCRILETVTLIMTTVIVYAS